MANLRAIFNGFIRRANPARGSLLRPAQWSRTPFRVPVVQRGQDKRYSYGNQGQREMSRRVRQAQRAA